MSINPSQYIIIDDIIIIHPRVNKQLDLNFFEDKNKFNKIIFSNHKLLPCALNSNYIQHITYWSPSQFNNNIIFTSTITHVTFGAEFNKSVDFPNGLTHLKFDDIFNQNILLPNSLIFLIFGFEFNKYVILPNGLKHLVLGRKFTHSMELTGSIDMIEIACNNAYLIDNLPNNISTLILKQFFNLPLNNLPSQLKKIIFENEKYNWELNDLPDSIEFIKLPYYYDKKILNLPKNLVKIECSSSYKFKHNYKKYL